MNNNHKTDSLQIALSCFLGGVIGSIIALSLGRYLWLFGVAIGGIVGYVSYEFERVIDPSRKCYREFKKNFSENLPEIFESTKDFLSSLFSGIWRSVLTFLSMAVASLIISLSWVIMMILAIITFPPPDIGYRYTPSFFFAINILVSVIVLMGILISREDGHFEEKSNKETALMLFNCTSMGVIGTIILFLVKTIINLPKIIGATYKFTIQAVFMISFALIGLVILIHSKKRLLCLTGAAIGACAGYLLGFSLLGGAIGIIAGLVQFEIISIRLLKLEVK